MSSESLPVTVGDMRNALALCKAKFETEAAAHRERALEVADDLEHLRADWPNDDDCDRLPDVIRAETDAAESCDRMASSVGAIARAPFAPAFESGFLVVGAYNDGSRFAETYQTETADEAEALAPSKVRVAGVVRLQQRDNRVVFDVVA